MTEKEAKLAKEYQALKDRNQLMEAQLESMRYCVRPGCVEAGLSFPPVLVLALVVFGLLGLCFYVVLFRVSYRMVKVRSTRRTFDISYVPNVSYPQSPGIPGCL